MDARKSTCFPPLPLPLQSDRNCSKCLNFQIGRGCPEPITFYITRRTMSYFELPSDFIGFSINGKKMTNTIHLNEITDALMICTAVRISMKLKAHH